MSDNKNINEQQGVTNNQTNVRATFVPIPEPEGLDIYGKTYVLNQGNREWLTKVSKLQQSLKASQTKLSIEGYNIKTHDELIKKASDMIDFVLGDGEAKRILDAAKGNVYQILGVTRFLTEQLPKQRDEMIKNYLSMNTERAAQRGIEATQAAQERKAAAPDLKIVVDTPANTDVEPGGNE